MYSLSEVKRKGKRSNDESNRRLHFFASHFSIFFSWIFINLRLSANAVTGIFFVTGLCGAILLTSNNVLVIVIAYSLWRLHIIFDICDGEVARFTQKFSINGAYWDYMIHSILYPFTYVSICFALYNKFSEVTFLYLGLAGSIIVSQTLSVKNNYYRAMLFNGLKIDDNKSSSKNSALKSYLVNISAGILNFEGFLLAYVILALGEFNKENYLLFLMLYTVSFFAQSTTKFILFSKHGFYRKRS